MKLAEVEHEALALPERERVSLAAKLLDTLPPPGTDVPDKEVERRERQLESGEVAAVLHEEFVRRVQRERGQSRSFTTRLSSKTFPGSQIGRAHV